MKKCLIRLILISFCEEIPNLSFILLSLQVATMFSIPGPSLTFVVFAEDEMTHVNACINPGIKTWNGVRLLSVLILNNFKQSPVELQLQPNVLKLKTAGITRKNC